MVANGYVDDNHWRYWSGLKHSSLSGHLMERRSQGDRGRAWSFCRAAWKFIFMNHSVISDIEVYLSFYILGVGFYIDYHNWAMSKTSEAENLWTFGWKKMFTCILRLGSSCRQTRPAGSSENIFLSFGSVFKLSSWSWHILGSGTHLNTSALLFLYNWGCFDFEVK